MTVVKPLSSVADFWIHGFKNEVQLMWPRSKAVSVNFLNRPYLLQLGSLWSFLAEF